MALRELNSKIVEATVLPGQRLFSQRGAMLAYRGEVSFTPNMQGGQGGVMSMIGRRMANEDTPDVRRGQRHRPVRARRPPRPGHQPHRRDALRRGRPAARLRGHPPAGDHVHGLAGRRDGHGPRPDQRPGPVHHDPEGPRLGRRDGPGGVFEVPITPSARSTSTRRPTSPTTATSATSCRPPWAGGTWWAAAPARRSSWS